MDPETPNKSLPKQLVKLMSKMTKWEGILADFEAYALDNDGVIDSKESKRISRLQKNIEAIKNRVLKIAAKKGISLNLDKEEEDSNDSYPFDDNNMLASTGNDFVVMDYTLPEGLASIIDATNFDNAIKHQLKILFNDALDNDTDKEQLNSIINAISIYFNDPDVALYYKADQNKAVLSYLQKINLNNQYNNLERAFKSQLKEHGKMPADDDTGGDTKLKLSIGKPITDWFNKWISTSKPLGNIGKIPVKFVISGVSAYFDLALEKNDLTTNLTDGLVFEGFRRAINLDKNLNSSMTLASFKPGAILDFGAMKFTVKFDFGKIDYNLTSIPTNIINGDVNPEFAAVTFQAVFPDLPTLISQIFDGVENKRAVMEALSLSECNAKISFKVALAFDLQAYAKQKALEEGKDKMGKEVKDKVEKEILKKMDLEEKATKKAAQELLKKEGEKAASKTIQESIVKLEKLNKGLKSKVAKEIGENVIKRSGGYVIKSIAARGLLKLIPIVNIISTIYDVFWIGCAVYNYFNSAQGMSEADVQRMNKAKDREFRLERKRDQQEENPRNKRFIILRVIEGLANDNNGQYRGRFGKTDWVRHHIYIKFYEDSYTAGQYFGKREKYADIFVEEGSEMAGDGVKIAFDIYKEEQLNETDSLSYDNHKMMRLKGDDMGALMLVKKYSDLTRRMELD